MSDMELLIGREQRLVTGQKMYQSMNLLQMSAEELTAYLNELSMENPLIELTPPRAGDADIYARARSGRVRGRGGGDYELPIPDKSLNSLRGELTEQLSVMHLSAELDAALRFLIVNLDDRGYLPTELSDSGTWQSAPRLFERARELLRSMDPAGVGAGSLSECLCLQLQRRGMGESLAYAICQDYLEHLARDHINHISKALGVTPAQVAQAREQIRALDPIPSNGYDDGCCDCWIVPDIQVTLEEGEPVVSGLQQRLPECEVNGYYRSMLQSDAITQEERQYFVEKLTQAQWVVNSIIRRRETMLRCAAAIVEQQREFFTEADGALRPCSMTDIADRLEMHPSTVSRAFKNKYLICDRGLFPMSYFFAYDVGGDTSDEITKAIKALVEGEDPLHPLSDSSICSRLSQQGYDVARRTVAKYREKALIPSAPGRKRHD